MSGRHYDAAMKNKLLFIYVFNGYRLWYTDTPENEPLIQGDSTFLYHIFFLFITNTQYICVYVFISFLFFHFHRHSSFLLICSYTKLLWFRWNGTKSTTWMMKMAFYNSLHALCVNYLQMCFVSFWNKTTAKILKYCELGVAGLWFVCRITLPNIWLISLVFHESAINKSVFIQRKIFYFYSALTSVDQLHTSMCFLSF